MTGRRRVGLHPRHGIRWGRAFLLALLIGAFPQVALVGLLVVGALYLLRGGHR